MNEKDMVNDVISMTKQGTTTYTTAISECSNKDLRQTFQNMRNSDEEFQYTLSQIAIQKGYYKPSQTTTLAEKNKVKADLSL